MYHHRYQPQTSHQVNETNSAFACNNHSKSSLSSTARDYHLSARAPVGSTTDPSTTASSSTSSSATYQSNNSFVGHNRIGSKNLAYHSGAYFLQPKQFAEERQDVIFRRVRGILNKITPETFDKLSKELVNVGLDSPRTLRGLIYLLFDKALKDLKYSSLYAKLCQELSERSPNFEKEPGPNTFCKFLISKCEDEFERRRKATEDFDNKNELTDEEFEQKVIAKQKMLGNIKFICELGKKRLLQEEILHECIRGLLSKKRERPLQDQAQDLECLCQIMRTIGSLLDIEASRNLMNQYFERIDMFSRKPELPSRIRFMLRDVIDLRNNNWRPRPFQREDTVPQPLSKLREESGFSNAASNPPIDKLGNTKNLRNMSDLSKLHGNKLSSLLLDDDGPSFTTTTDFHWGPTYLSHEADFDMFTSGISNSYTNEAPHKPIPIKVSDTSSSLTVSRTQPFNHAQPYLGQRFSQNDRSDKPINDTQNRVDPISKSNKSDFNRSGHGIRDQVDFDDVMNRRHNEFVNDRSEGSWAHERRYFNREESRNLQTHRQPNASTRRPDTNHIAIARQERDDIPDKHNRGNNDFKQGINPSIRRSSVNRDEVRPNQDHHQLHFEPVRQIPHNRSNNPTLGPKKTASHRHPEDSLSPRPPLPLTSEVAPQDGHKHFVTNKPMPEISHQACNQSGNIEINSSNLGQRKFDHPRDRREFEQAFKRQPKFSGANYRLPGRDRLPPPLKNPQIINRNQAPESESNLNWRSAGSTRSVQSTKNVAMQQPKLEPLQPVNPTDIFDPSSKFASKGQDRPDQGLGEQPKVEARVNDFKSERAGLMQQPLIGAQRSYADEDDASKINVGNPSPQNELNRHVLHLGGSNDHRPHYRSDDDVVPARRQRPESRLVSDDSMRPQNDRNHGFRTGPRDLNNRRGANDNQRVSTLPPGQNVEQGGDPAQLHSRKSGEKFGGRDYRPAMGRNQSFDNVHPSEIRRGPNWRQEGPVQNNIQVNRRENQPSIPTLATNPILPKAPTRISATDFTLRPSHNLIGRTLPDWTAQPKPVEATQQNKEVPSIENRQTPVLSSENISTSDHAKKESEIDEVDPEESLRNAAKLQNVTKFVSAFAEHLGNNPSDTSKLVSRVKDLKIPRDHHDECIVAVIKHSIVRSEAERADTSKLLGQLVPTIMEPIALLSAFRIIFDQLHVLEVETPKVKSLVAEFLSRAVVDGMLCIEEVAQVLIGGKHHPLFLLFLQKLERSAGQAWLSDKFMKSRVNLMDMLPEVDRTKDRLASALKDRCLGFLDPMLTIEPDLWSQMRDRDPSPAAVYRWIKDNVDQSIQSTPTFAHVFIVCLLRYIHQSVMERSKATNNNNINHPKDSDSSGSNKSPSDNSPSHSINDYEKELLSRYQQVMHALLEDKQMQLATLHALQSFYHGLDFPKGALLRWFHMLYDLSIVDDDVFFIWKEEINDKVPGKGQALFQVNTWLNWLAEAEDEDEEDV